LSNGRWRLEGDRKVNICPIADSSLNSARVVGLGSQERPLHARVQTRL
jgi:hypothetical protein